MPCGEKKERCRDGVACVSYLFVYFFLYNSTQNVLASFIQNPTNISVIRAAIATSQRRRYEWVNLVICHLRSWEPG